MKKLFKIECNQLVQAWQRNIFEIEAESEREARKILENEPQSNCVETETFYDTEDVIKTDFEENFYIEEMF